MTFSTRLNVEARKIILKPVQYRSIEEALRKIQEHFSNAVET